MTWKTNWRAGVDSGHDTLHNDLGKRLNKIVYVGDPGIDTIQAGIDAGGVVFIPDGDYTLTEPLTLKSRVRLICESLNTKIVNEATNLFEGSADYFELAGGTWQATAGHGFAPTALNHAYIHDCRLVASHAEKSVIHLPLNSNYSFVGNVFERCWLEITPQHSAAGVALESDGNVIANTWRDCTCYYSGAQPFFIVHNAYQRNAAYDNRWQSCIFQVPQGGCIKLLGCNHATIVDCHAYDTVTDITDDLFYLGAGDGGQCVSCIVQASGRRGGTLAEGVYDINVDEATNSVLIGNNAAAEFAYRVRVGESSTNTQFIADAERGTALA